MTMLRLSEMTWTEVRELDRSRVVAILPTGAVEAHGPHLPLVTDRIIAQAMAEEGARGLADHDLTGLLLPPVDYTAAPFGAAFAGTLSVRPETVTALLVDIADALASHQIRHLAIANAHLDPAHLGALYTAVKQIRAAASLTVTFPDIARKPWALRLTDEFKSGACHAGQYEGSVVLAARPDLVRSERSTRLAPNPASLSTAIRAGQTTFEQAGGPEAYFGDPAAATAVEGRETIAILGQILVDAVLENGLGATS